jgi:anthranilate/para-aminobenzoate synthase component I
MQTTIKELRFENHDFQNLFDFLPTDKKILLETTKVTKEEKFSFIALYDEVLTIKESWLFKEDKLLSKNPIDYLENLVSSWNPQNLGKFSHIPFVGGIVTLLSYEFRCFLEKTSFHKNNDLKTPHALFALCNQVLAFDHFDQTIYLCKTKNDLDFDVEEAIQTYTRHRHQQEHKTKLNKPAEDICSDFSKEEYCKSVNKIKEYILDGHTYQTNLSQRFSCSQNKSSWEIYKSLMKINPVSFAGFFKFYNFTFICGSPERLVKRVGDFIVTRPIAGTLNKQGDLNTFLEDSKEAAEHAMLVDLARNDLGKICKPGSVKVSSYKELVEYKHVFHFESDVIGKIRSEIKVFDIIKALFPGGTITGVPKIRTMEIISELEPQARGFYTGALGYIDFRKNLDLNIIIRSVHAQNDKLFINVGGGVTIDSDPEKEYEETLNKAKSQFVAIMQGLR